MLWVFCGWDWLQKRNVSSDQVPWGAPLSEDAHSPAAAGITEQVAVNVGGAAAAAAARGLGKEHSQRKHET